MTPRAPLRAHLRRRRDSHAACSRTRARWRRVVRPGLGLDRDGDPAGRDRHRVDVSPTLPRQRMPQPPALRLQRCQRALDGVLRAGPDPTPASEREPVARAQAERSGDDEQAHGDESRTHAGGPQAKERGADGPDPRFAGAREPAVLLAPRIVHPVCPDDHRSSSSALARAAASSSHFGCLPGARSTAWRIASRAVEPCRQSRWPARRASHSQFHRLPGRCERHCWRTTSTGPLGVGTVTVSERLAIDLPAITPPRARGPVKMVHARIVPPGRDDSATPRRCPRRDVTRASRSNTSAPESDEDQHHRRDRHIRPPRPGRLRRRCARPTRRPARRSTRRAVERPGAVARAEPLVDAAEIARLHGKTRSWVYEHAGELGAVRLGSGPRPRLGVLARARRRAAREGRQAGDRTAARSQSPAPAPAPAGRSYCDGCPLLHVRSVET